MSKSYTARKFYAVEYAYGRGVVNNGNRADIYHAFSTKAERNSFVAAGNQLTGPGSRDAVSASSVPAYAKTHGINLIDH